jgi:hypothetical protein
MRHLTPIAVLVMTFAALTRSASAADTFQPGVDLPGYVYRNFDLSRPRPRLCQAACENDERCRAWTFVRVGVIGPLSSCWLKSDVPQPRPDSCCVSGRR